MVDVSQGFICQHQQFTCFRKNLKLFLKWQVSCQLY